MNSRQCTTLCLIPKTGFSLFFKTTVLCCFCIFCGFLTSTESSRFSSFLSFESIVNSDPSPLQPYCHQFPSFTLPALIGRQFFLAKPFSEPIYYRVLGGFCFYWTLFPSLTFYFQMHRSENCVPSFSYNRIWVLRWGIGGSWAGYHRYIKFVWQFFFLYHKHPCVINNFIAQLNVIYDAGIRLRRILYLFWINTYYT